MATAASGEATSTGLPPMAFVNQERALQRARRRGGYAAGVMLPVLAIMAWKNYPWGLLPFAGLAIAGLLSWVGARRQANNLARQFGPAEVRIEGFAPGEMGATYEALRRHMRNFWLVHVRDCRGWNSIYLAPINPAPLQLPFEFHVDGADVVLRGSKQTVEAAHKFLRKRLGRARLQIPHGVPQP